MGTPNRHERRKANTLPVEPARIGPVTTAMLSQGALLRRINRKLAHETDESLGNIRVLKCRTDSRWYGDLGDYYSVDTFCSAIEATNVDLEAWGRDLDVLAAGERVSP